MADQKISQLTGAATPLAGTEELPLVQGGVTKKVSIDNLTAGKAITALSVEVGAGTVSAPSITTTGETDTGIYFPAADTISFAEGGNEIARFTSDGLTFNGDTSADNALDDYEEGTWSPILADAGLGGNEISGAEASAIYTKVGRLVTVQCQITNFSTGGLTAGNDLYIRGLPFTAASVAGTMLLPGSVILGSTTFSGYVTPAIFDNTSHLRFAENDSGNNVDYLIVSEFTSGSADIYLNITYQAA